MSMGCMSALLSPDQRKHGTKQQTFLDLRLLSLVLKERRELALVGIGKGADVDVAGSSTAESCHAAING